MKSVLILGTKIMVLNTYDDCWIAICSLIRKDESQYITVNNVHTVIEAVRDPQFQFILNSSSISVPDGKPLSIVARMKGYKRISRIFGPTLMEYGFQQSQGKEIRHFLFGSTTETIAAVTMKIAEMYPESILCGAVSPPFRMLTEEENHKYIDMMKAAKADIIWVGLGAPKQERWIYENYQKLPRGVFIGIGAGFDYMAGNIKHAPAWAKQYSLEWFFRLMQDPQRLWKRYLTTNSQFLVLIAIELIKEKIVAFLSPSVDKPV